MPKDPAALFFIADWLTSTKEMHADERGWYLNLILHQYDKGSLPNNVEELANLCDVRFSEYEQFNLKWEQVLKQKFKLNGGGRLYNERASEIIKKRELFKDKRSDSGKLGYLVKFIHKNFDVSVDQVNEIKNTIDIQLIDTKNEQFLKQMLEQMLKQTSKL